MSITLVKVNVLTDDPELPAALKRRIEEVLSEFVDDDPDGPAKARMHIAYKATPFPESYMTQLPKPNSERVGPTKKKAIAPPARASKAARTPRVSARGGRLER